MAKITLDSHDLLGQLTIVKSCLMMVEAVKKNQIYLDRAMKSTQNIIDLVKKTTINGQNSSD
ncbi:MAG: hypothetical protein ABH807_01885 [Candidatus Shapirobacteria bacterium]